MCSPFSRDDDDRDDGLGKLREFVPGNSAAKRFCAEQERRNRTRSKGEIESEERVFRRSWRRVSEKSVIKGGGESEEEQNQKRQRLKEGEKRRECWLEISQHKEYQRKFKGD
ncbi:hypothetical protein Droror1_Dr00022664 [Drosera rotundifolia]